MQQQQVALVAQQAQQYAQQQQLITQQQGSYYNPQQNIVNPNILRTYTPTQSSPHPTPPYTPYTTLSYQNSSIIPAYVPPPNLQDDLASQLKELSQEMQDLQMGKKKKPHTENLCPYPFD